MSNIKLDLRLAVLKQSQVKCPVAAINQLQQGRISYIPNESLLTLPFGFMQDDNSLSPEHYEESGWHSALKTQWP